MSTLFELTAIAKNIYDIAEGDEELIEDSLSAIDWSEQFEDKADGYAMVIKGLQATVKARKDEIKRMQELNKSDENKLLKLKESLQTAMTVTDHRRFKTLLFNFRIQKNPERLTVDDEKLIPDYFFDTVKVLDNAALRERLKAGDIILGARLESTESLRF